MRTGSFSFIDAHVHIAGHDALQNILSAGVGAVRNAGMKKPAIRERNIGCFRPPAPIVVSSCWALFKKGGYGGRFGEPVESVSGIKEEIRKLERAGADIVKVMASGIVSLKNPGTITPGGFTAEELKIIAAEAAARGLEVMAHANSETAIIAAAEAGVRSIEHGFFMTNRALDVMAKKETYWVPTVGAIMRAAAADTGASTKAFIADLVDRHLSMLNHAFSRGVPLAVGTDCVLPAPRYREAYQQELSCFERAGIPHDRVAEIACEGGAKLLGIKI
jgi:imidazolonepropionase-like amidohydrolase